MNYKIFSILIIFSILDNTNNFSRCFPIKINLYIKNDRLILHKIYLFYFNTSIGFSTIIFQFAKILVIYYILYPQFFKTAF